MKNIVLIGMPGAGKTTFGQALARRLHRRFVDADDVVEEITGLSIPQMFEHGEKWFRDRETETLEKLSGKEDLVIATGGGAVLREKNVKLLKNGGVIIFLDRSPQDIVSDVVVETRPLLADGPERVMDLYRNRIAQYRKAADVVVPNRGKEEDVLASILAMLKDMGIE
jgi:shikimate kinase